MKRASPTHGGRWLAQTNYDTLVTHHTTKNRLLPIYTSILLLKLGVDIQSQTEARVRKPNKANLRDLIAATSVVILLKIGFKLSIIGPFHLKFDGWPWKSIGHLFYTSSFVHHFKAISEFKLELQSGNTKFGSKSAIFCLRDLEIWWIALQKNRAPLLYYIKLCAPFQSHQWIQTWVTVWKRSIQVKIGDFPSHVTLTFDGWPWKTIGHLFYAQFGSKSTGFFSHVN